MPRATDILPITSFTRAYKRVAAQLRKSGRAHVLTIDGKPSLIVQDAAAYDQLVELIDAIYVDAAISRALADPRPKRTVEQVRKNLSKRWPSLTKKKGRPSKAA